MSTRPANSFCKTFACPSDHDLLAFHETSLTSEERQVVELHLDLCDFCCAELQLLMSFPQADLCCCDQAADLPAPLRRLAEALMSSHQSALLSLFDISPDNEVATASER